MIIEAIYISAVFILIKIVQILINIVIYKNPIPRNELIPFFISLIIEAIITFFAFLVFMWLSLKIKGDSISMEVLILILFVSILRSHTFIIEPLILMFKSKKRQRNELSFDLSKDLKKDYKILVIDSEEINAYATGFTRWNSVILLTKKLIDTMSHENIKNLIYHEIGHLKEKHLFILFIINIISTTFMIMLLTPVIQFLETLPYTFIFVSLTGGSFAFLFVFIIPGFVQKRLEYRADAYAVNMVGYTSYLETLRELNSITKNGLEKSSFSHPTLEQRLSKLKAKV